MPWVFLIFVFRFRVRCYISEICETRILVTLHLHLPLKVYAFLHNLHTHLDMFRLAMDGGPFANFVEAKVLGGLALPGT